MKIRFVFILLFLAVLQGFAHSVVRNGDMYVVTHEWKYQDRQWSCSLNIPVELYRYYQGRAHQSDEHVKFVLSDHDRNCIKSLVSSFREGGAKVGYSSSDNMHNVISFVQSLSYVTDLESTGESDYIRFPVETLVDGVGDCEDMAILAAAILNEMGYGVLLVQLPEHLALAVNCGTEFQGSYYNYQGSRYYYLEVTNTGWDIGQIPDGYKNSQAQLIPLVYRPHMRIPHCSYSHDSYYTIDREVYYKVEFELENGGPGSTDGLTVRVLFVRHNGSVAVERTFHLDELQEGESGKYEVNIPVPRPFYGKLEIRMEGRNFDRDSSSFNSIELD